MEITKEGCSIQYKKETSEIFVVGTMRLFGSEHYADIASVLSRAAEDESPNLTLDITRLQFLNSSGINVFFKFLIDLRKRNRTKLTIKGTNEYFWQKKTLLNFQKILPGTALEY